MRDITVPIGTSSILAISAYENSSTSRNQTAWRKMSGNSSSAARRSASSVFRSRSCSGVSPRCEPSARRLGLFEARAVDLDCGRLASGVPKAIPPRVVQDRRQPGPEVRAALEPVREAQRLDERVLHQVFGIGPVPGQPQRRRVERLEVTQNLRAERVSVCGLATSEHRRYRDPLDQTRGGVWNIPRRRLRLPAQSIPKPVKSESIPAEDGDTGHRRTFETTRGTRFLIRFSRIP